MAESVAPPAPHRAVDIETAQGVARAYIVDASGEAAGRSEQAAHAASSRGVVVLGHGAGKGTNTPDLWGLTALADVGWKVILVDQPWVLAGRRVASPPKRLDEAWVVVLNTLREQGELSGTLVVGGRSAGARVACRTAVEVGADAVVALAFPLKPPGKKEQPEKWRSHEAQAAVDAELPLLVVQGATDAFGAPGEVREEVPDAEVVEVKGGHSFAAHPDDVVRAVHAWVERLK